MFVNYQHMEDNLTRDDLEPGYTYVTDHGNTANKFIFKFKHKSLRDRPNNVIGSDVISEKPSFCKVNQEIQITVNGYPLRKATIEEDIWLEECIKAGKHLTKEEAIANFNKKFVIEE